MARWVWVAVFAMVGALLAACGEGATTGSLTGHAAPCLGPHLAPAQRATIPVRVTVTEHSKVIADQTVRGSHTYRFNLAPGRYVVSSNASRPVSIILRAGEVQRVNLGDLCK